MEDDIQNYSPTVMFRRTLCMFDVQTLFCYYKLKIPALPRVTPAVYPLLVLIFEFSYFPQ